MSKDLKEVKKLALNIKDKGVPGGFLVHGPYDESVPRLTGGTVRRQGDWSRVKREYYRVDHCKISDIYSA